jgi:hypothetical protein
MSIPATYSIQIFARNGENIHAELFQGAQAFTDACGYFETAKSFEQAAEIWFTRMDGPEPAFVGKPIARGEDGTWQEEKDSEDR